MQRFPTVSPRLHFEIIKEDNLFRSEKLFDTFPIHSVNLLVPVSQLHIESLEDVLISEETVYFIIKNVSAKCLIEKSFLEQFIKSGTLLATTHNARVEVENFVSIIPPGKLILSLEKEISRCLGLSKEKPSKKKKGRKTFETIIIDINCREFSPGKKIYEFVAFELSKIEHIKFTLLLKWRPKGNVCPQSLKTYFASQNIECIVCKPSHKYSSKSSVIAPKLNETIFDQNIVEDLLEWIGAEVCGVNYSSDENEYVSKFFPPPSSESLNKLHRCSFEGFYSKIEAIPLLTEIRKLFQDNVPFVVAFFSGFQDCFISTNGFQLFSSADKLICIVMFPSSNYWLITLNAR